MKKILFLILLCNVITNKKAYAQPKVLTQEQMVAILVDLELANAWAHTMDTIDEQEKEEQQFNMLCKAKFHQIYYNHNTDYLTFKNSYLHYLYHTALLVAIYEQVIFRLEKLWEHVE